jgi:phage shock protein A
VALERELVEYSGLVDQYQGDIQQLEDKLASARERQRMLVQRHVHANKKRRAQEEIRRMESSEAVYKFEEMENRIERMEAEADLVNFGRKPRLEAEFDELMMDEEIEKELHHLKSTIKKDDQGVPVA